MGCFTREDIDEVLESFVVDEMEIETLDRDKNLEMARRHLDRQLEMIHEGKRQHMEWHEKESEAQELKEFEIITSGTFFLPHDTFDFLYVHLRAM